MTTEQRTEGDNFIQCCSISSTSDVYARPFVSDFVIRGRPSYRLFPNTQFPEMSLYPESFPRMTSRFT